jgi:ABC-type taurine transport system ATPase subunit
VCAGSGKTTLLNVMAGRMEHRSSMGMLTRLGVEGSVLYNDIALAAPEVTLTLHSCPEGLLI